MSAQQAAWEQLLLGVQQRILALAAQHCTQHCTGITHTFAHKGLHTNLLAQDDGPIWPGHSVEGKPHTWLEEAYSQVESVNKMCRK